MTSQIWRSTCKTLTVLRYIKSKSCCFQKLAGFTKGQADSLRKAMGKKKIEEMNKLFDLFISQGTEKGHKEETLKKVWKDW